MNTLSIPLFSICWVLPVGAAPAFLLPLMDVEETLERPKYGDFASRYKNWLISLELFMNEINVGFKNPIMRTYMIATSLSWFFSDILHYGNILMQGKKTAQNRAIEVSNTELKLSCI